jgi:hypothetical protein
VRHDDPTRHPEPSRSSLLVDPPVRLDIVGDLSQKRSSKHHVMHRAELAPDIMSLIGESEEGLTRDSKSPAPDRPRTVPERLHRCRLAPNHNDTPLERAVWHQSASSRQVSAHASHDVRCQIVPPGGAPRHVSENDPEPSLRAPGSRRLNKFSTWLQKRWTTRHGGGVLSLGVDREEARVVSHRERLPMGVTRVPRALGCAIAVAVVISGLWTSSSGASSLASSHVTIGFEGTRPRYLYGKVTSPSDGCEDLRKVAIFKQRGDRGGGDDIRFASTTAYSEVGPSAWWIQDLSGSTAGRFYARVPRTDSCERDASTTIRVEAQG